jgi:hypothetical protein
MDGVPVRELEPVVVCVFVGVLVVEGVSEEVIVGLLVELAVPDLETVWLGEIQRGVGVLVPLVVREPVTVAVPLTERWFALLRDLV